MQTEFSNLANFSITYIHMNKRSWNQGVLISLRTISIFKGVFRISIGIIKLGNERLGLEDPEIYMKNIFQF